MTTKGCNFKTKEEILEWQQRRASIKALEAHAPKQNKSKHGRSTNMNIYAIKLPKAQYSYQDLLKKNKKV